MKKNLPYFLVIASLIFLIAGVLLSGEKETQSIVEEAARLMDKPVKLMDRPVSLADKPKSAQTVVVASREAEMPAVVTETKMRQQRSGEKKILFNFEDNIGIWEIPDWCFEKNDYVGQTLSISKQVAREGASSLEVLADFPGAKWTAAYVEAQAYFDWTAYQSLSADVYLPESAPFGLKAKIILTVGEDWQWTEMSRFVKLVPGEWTTITASLDPGTTDWRRTQVDDQFRADVRKLGLRVESNMQPVYGGPIYFDNVVLE